MVSAVDVQEVRTLMLEFAQRTGLSTSAIAPRRYLWTDGFAVCNFLSMYEVMQDSAWLERATGLIEQVHATLGRHRRDDARAGWISGLDEAAGSRHPTAGGLRIGKPLNERPAGQPVDEALEWERDGQYFHYLTKWMQALARAAVVTADPNYCRLAIELAKAAHAAFTYTAPGRGALQMYWKMSIDLSRPLVPAMGQHDPLDALVSYSVLERCRVAHFADADLPNLESEIEEAAGMCAGREWVTDDPLGLGGLLVDAYRVSLMRAHGVPVAGLSLSRLLTDARAGFARFAHIYPLDAAAERRLAFRELGLSIGLHALEALRQQALDGAIELAGDEPRELDTLISAAGLARRIESFWRAPANRSAATWLEHLDINAVMLATSLLPRQFLAVDGVAAAN